VRITFVHRHFWPEPLTYALMLRHICSALAAHGHEVSMISVRTAGTQRPDDAASLPGVRVRRIAMQPERKDQWLRRVTNAAWYLLAASVTVALSRRPDVVVAATTPPVLPAWLMSTICRIRGAAFVYHYQDLHPESLALVGTIRQPWLLAVLGSLDRMATRRALRRVVLSDDMGRALQARRGCRDLDYTVLNNFDPGEADPAADAETPALLPGAGIRVLFAGNLGLFQGLEQVVDAFAALGEQNDICLILLGDGALLGLVSLSGGVIRYAYPSKVMTYLDAGLPLLAIVEPDSELARMIVEEDIGFVCAPGATAQLTQLLREVRVKSRETLRARCQALAVERFSRERALRQWCDLFRGLS
jgi:glycosyltransferase involved in cell wall biosynthesis